MISTGTIGFVASIPLVRSWSIVWSIKWFGARYAKPKHDIVWLEDQCDQIGRFSKDLGHKFSYKISPNNCWLFWLFLVLHFLRKNCCYYFLGYFLGYFSFQHLVTVFTTVHVTWVLLGLKVSVRQRRPRADLLTLSISEMVSTPPTIFFSLKNRLLIRCLV